MSRQFQSGRKIMALSKMALKKPSGMDECIYFTNRTIDSGRAIAWVFKKKQRERRAQPCGTGKAAKMTVEDITSF